jgi:hypothetical protein
MYFTFPDISANSAKYRKRDKNGKREKQEVRIRNLANCSKPASTRTGFQPNVHRRVRRKQPQDYKSIALESDCTGSSTESRLRVNRRRSSGLKNDGWKITLNTKYPADYFVVHAAEREERRFVRKLRARRKPNWLL